jgi:prevent-host-death family protein
MTTIIPVTKARTTFTSLVQKANRQLDEFVITVNGLPAAVLISAAEYESWKETMDILSNRKLLKAIREGEKDLQNGKFVTFDQLKKDLHLHV